MTRTDPPEDPIRAAEVKRAVEPYRAIYPPELVVLLEEMLDHVLSTHPVGAELLNRVRPRAAREQSGPQAKDGIEVAPAKKAGAK